MQGYCSLSAVPMRREPSDCSEMVNQLLRGDTFEVLRRDSAWSLIRCDYDGYEGWVDNKQWSEFGGQRSTDSSHSPILIPRFLSPSDVALCHFLGSPYLWGGRTVLGIDCSGLTQVCFKACGIVLLRDASQQATQGVEVPSIEEVRRDDLCFFQNDAGRVVHVGIALGGGRIVHASGQVRVDCLDVRGIYNPATERYTHRLHSIRRMKER